MTRLVQLSSSSSNNIQLGKPSIERNQSCLFLGSCVSAILVCQLNQVIELIQQLFAR